MWPIFCFLLLALTGAKPAALAISPNQETAAAFHLSQLNFKVNFRIQSFMGGQPQTLIDVSESYHSKLATGLIRQLVHRHTVAGIHREQREIFYDTVTRQLAEFHLSRALKSTELADDNDQLMQAEFELYENGGSNGYARHLDQELASNLRWPQHSVRLIKPGGALDSLLLLAGLKKTIELDAFMSPDCLALIRRQLHYVNGLSRLLLLVECRRADFKLQFSSEPEQLTRGLARRVYTAKGLTGRDTSADIKQIDLTVTLPLACCESEQTDGLPSNCVPLSMALTFTDGTEGGMLLLNVFQFETLEAVAHLSESASAAGHSSYLLPLNQPELSALLDGARAADRLSVWPKFRFVSQSSFSFRATLTSSHRGNPNQRLLTAYPVELVMIYDGQARLIARQMEFVDRTLSSDGVWRRNAVRTLYDGHSNIKYHVMRDNFNYNNLDEYGQLRRLNLSSSSAGSEFEFDWRACATDALDHTDQAALESGGGELFTLTSATFMGTALVRGIPAYVFERRLFNMPQLLDLGLNDYVHLKSMASSEIYMQSYVAMDRACEEQFADLPGYFCQRPLVAPKFVRIDIRVVSTLDQEAELSFRLELHAFDWSTHLEGDVPDLLEVGQACLLSQPNARHLDAEFWFALETRQNSAVAQLAKHQLEALKWLKWDPNLRQVAIERLLAEAYDFSAAQQVDLETQINGFEKTSRQKEKRQIETDSSEPIPRLVQLRAKLSLYEPPDEKLQEHFLGYGQDLSRNAAATNLHWPPQTGARVHSFAECRWRAAHTLQWKPQMGLDDWSTSTDSAAGENVRLFMFCPRSRLCLLGDDSWLPLPRGRKLEMEGLFRFPYPTDENLPSERADRCVFVSLQMHGPRRDDSLSLAGRWARLEPQLDWLLAQRANNFERMRAQPLELKVELEDDQSRVRLPSEVDISPNEKEVSCVSLPLVLQHVKMSSKIFAATPVSHEEEEEVDVEARSLLVKPLVGLGYLAPPNANDRPATMTGSSGVVEPLLAFNLAECARACAQQHECASYSACHQPNGKLACLFSPLVWSRRAHFELLLGLLRRSGGNSTVQLELEEEPPLDPLPLADLGGHNAQPTGTRLIRVLLKRSRLCSLHARPQVELFQSVQRSHLAARPVSKFLLRARSSDECARFCLERGQLMRELVAAELPATVGSMDGDWLETRSASLATLRLAKYREFSCNSFEFQSASSSCELLPPAHHWRLLGLEHLLVANSTAANFDWSEASARFATLRRWRAQLSRPETRRWLSDQSAASSSFGESERFQLDFTQIFLAQRSRRISLADMQHHDHSPPVGRLQVRQAGLDVSECGQRCIKLLGCRSFDVQLQADSSEGSSFSSTPSAAQSCVLNVLALADLWPARAELSARNETAVPANWWHYEPSELALFLLLEPQETAQLPLGRLASDENTSTAFLLAWPPAKAAIAAH